MGLDMDSVSESSRWPWPGLQDLGEKVHVFVWRGIRVDVEDQGLDPREDREYLKEVDAIGR
jgi:hypothetical protein